MKFSNTAYPYARMIAPSAVAASGEMYTDSEGLKPFPVPEAMTGDDIRTAIAEYAQAAKNAVAAGFDGIEVNVGIWDGQGDDPTPEAAKRTKGWLDACGIKALTVQWGEDYCRHQHVTDQGCEFHNASSLTVRG